MGISNSCASLNFSNKAPYSVDNKEYIYYVATKSRVAKT